VAAICPNLASYRFYAAFIAAKVMALDPHRATPMHLRQVMFGVMRVD
jgi:carbon starvation protein CstA